MNKLILAARCGILTLALVITGVLDVQAQGQCENIDRVNVNMWPLPAVQGTTIRNDFGKITSEVLTAIQKIEYDAADTPSLTPELRQSVHNIAENYCVLKGIDRAYKVLVVPVYDAPMRYEIRGLHLVSRSGASSVDLPQAILTFNIQRDQVTIENIDIEFKSNRDAQRQPVGGREKDVHDLIKGLESAYNEAEDNIINALGQYFKVSEDGGENEVAITVSKIYDNGTEAPPRAPKNASAYLRDLGRYINTYGATKISFELIDLFKLDEDNDDLYRATLIQHWMYEGRNSYHDSDFLAIDVKFVDGTPVIIRRHAGRGAFNIFSDPAGIEIATVNGHEWTEADEARVTPFKYIINAPLQHHKLVLDNVWYHAVDTTRLYKDVLSREDIYVEMAHKPGSVIVNVMPEEENGEETRVGIANDLTGERQQNNKIISIPVDDLQLVPDSSLLPVSDPARNDRKVQINVRRDHYEPHEGSYTLTSPDTREIDVELQRLKGMLTVKSTPDNSSFEIRLDDPSILRPGTTEETVELGVTGNRDPYEVKIWNDTPFPSDRMHGGTSEQDYIRYVPDYQPATVVYGETTEVNAMLQPLYVHHKTEKGKLDITEVERTDDVLSVAYNLMDHKDRNRKYEVSLSLMQGEETLVVVDPESLSCSGEEPCAGKGLRPGANGFTWDFSDASSMLPEGYNEDLPVHPVLTLNRKGGCNWACVLIPAAAGVASAFIWPRTGKGGDDGAFIPPPRP